MRNFCKTRRPRPRPRLTIFMTAAVILATVCPVRALTVFDPANFSANTLQAGRALVQIRQGLTQIHHQLLMLKSIDLETAREVHMAMDAVQRLVVLSRELGTELQRGNYTGLSTAQVQSIQTKWNGQRRDAVLQAVLIQQAITDSMPHTASRIELINDASRLAPGQKGAVQANTQMLGQLSGQLQQLQAATLSAQRVVAVREAEQAAMLEYFRQRRLEIHRDDNLLVQRNRVSDPFPRAR